MALVYHVTQSKACQTDWTLEDDAKQLVSKAVETGHDVFYVTNNIAKKQTTYFGTGLGKSFLDEKRSLLIDFYQFCVENYKVEEIKVKEEAQTVSDQTNDSQERDESNQVEDSKNDQVNPDESCTDVGDNQNNDTPAVEDNEDDGDDNGNDDDVEYTPPLDDLKEEPSSNPTIEPGPLNVIYYEQVCMICQKYFKSSEYLKRHMELHGKLTYHCPECDKGFAAKRYIYSHMKTYHNLSFNSGIEVVVREHKIEEKNDNLKEILTPKRNEKDEIVHQCRICPKQFTNSLSLENHLLDCHKLDLAEGASPIEKQREDIKTRRSKRRSLKRREINKDKNTEEAEDTICKECGQVFKEAEYLRRHMELHKNKSYSCPDCDKTFAAERYIYSHMSSVHKKKYRRTENSQEDLSTEDTTLDTTMDTAADTTMDTAAETAMDTAADTTMDTAANTTMDLKSETQDTSLQQEEEVCGSDGNSVTNTPEKSDVESLASRCNLRSSQRKRKKKKWYDDPVPSDMIEDIDNEVDVDYIPPVKKVKIENKRKSLQPRRFVRNSNEKQTPSNKQTSSNTRNTRSASKQTRNNDEQACSNDEETSNNDKTDSTDIQTSGTDIESSSKTENGNNSKSVTTKQDLRKNLTVKSKKIVSKMAQNRNLNCKLLAGRCQEINIKGVTHYRCLTCLTVVKLRTTAIRHLKQHDNSKCGEYTCDICSMKFPTSYKLGNHLRTVHKQLNAYKCEKCSQKFSGRKHYLQHVEICDGNSDIIVEKQEEDQQLEPSGEKAENFLCDLCSRSFVHAEQLEEHSKTHVTSSGDLQCPYCSETFVEKKLLLQHMLREHPKRVKINEAQQKHQVSANPLQCCWCLKILTSQEYLEKHLKLHENPQIQCEVCDKQFHYEYQLRNHSQLHRDEYNYPCDMCDKKFKLERYLRKHKVEVHNIKRKVSMDTPQCKLCDIVFDKRSDLLEHAKEKHVEEISALSKIIKSETNQTSAYSCRRCQKQFKIYDDFAVHVTNHRPLQPLVCEVCGRTFKIKSNLNNHRLTHSNERPYACQHCPMKFKSKGSLYSHEIVRHKETQGFMCETCGMHFKLKGALRKHMRVHTDDSKYCCEVCGNKCRSFDGYKIHVLAKHPELIEGKKWKIYECEYCGKQMAMSQQYLRHITKHTGIKPHMCPHCIFSFPTKGSLNSHIRRAHLDSEKIFHCSICSVKFAEISKMKRHLESSKHLDVCVSKGLDHEAISETFLAMAKKKYKGQRRNRTMDIHTDIIKDYHVSDESDKEVEDVSVAADEILDDAAENVVEVKADSKEKDNSWMWKDSTVRQQTEILQQILADGNVPQSQVMVDGVTHQQQQITVEECTEQSGENCEVECYVIRLPENSLFTVV